MKTLSEGQYVTIKEDEYNRLIITATPEARNLRARGELWWFGESQPESSKVYQLIEDHLSDDWAHIYADEAGLMVGDDCLILSNAWSFTDDNEKEVWENMWYHERYAIELFSEQVFAGGVMLLPVPVQEEVTE